MPPRHALPSLWMMTDERQGEGLWRALERLPRGSGVVFRHHRLAPQARRALFERVRQVARRRRLLLLLAGPEQGARTWGADGAHLGSNPARPARMLATASAHDARELIAAGRAGASLVFLSPLFATRSHPDGRPLGRVRFARLAHGTMLPVVALGGVNRCRSRGLAGLGAAGWAAIDAWSR